VPRASLLGVPWSFPWAYPQVGLGWGLLCGGCWSGQPLVSGTSILLQLLDHPSRPWFTAFLRTWSRSRHDPEPALGHLLWQRVESSSDLCLCQRSGLAPEQGELVVLPVVVSGKTQVDNSFLHPLCSRSEGGEGLTGRWFHCKPCLDWSKYQSHG